MNVRTTTSPQAALPRTADEFVRWNASKDGRWNWVSGGIIDMMVDVSKAHALLCNRLLVALSRTLIFPPYTVSSADFGVKTASSVRYPDIMVDGQVGDLRSLAAIEPLLIAEVLSPSTMAIDFGPKATEYKTIPSLDYYLILSQDEPHVWLWSSSDDRAWPEEPLMIDAIESDLDLPALGLSLSIAELYSGIATDRRG